MRRIVKYTAGFVVAASITLAGCSQESPTTLPIDDQAQFFSRPPALGFDVLRRNAPLDDDVSVSSMVGPEGGTLELREAGIMFEIPAGALLEATSITMTARAGDAMAVEFAPHGLEFEIPAALHMSARGTPAEEAVREKPNGALLDSFMGVYFEGEPSSAVEPLETLDTYLRDGSIVFAVGHFSGYACASG